MLLTQDWSRISPCWVRVGLGAFLIEAVSVILEKDQPLLIVATSIHQWAHCQVSCDCSFLSMIVEYLSLLILYIEPSSAMKAIMWGMRHPGCYQLDFFHVL